MNRIANSMLAAIALGIFAASATSAGALENREVLYASCKKDLQLSDTGCDCLMMRMDAELNAKQQRFIATAISKDRDGMVKAQGELSGNEMMEVSTFMTQAPSQCQ
jgi:hypothetical protein